MIILIAIYKNLEILTSSVAQAENRDSLVPWFPAVSLEVCRVNEGIARNTATTTLIETISQLGITEFRVR